MRRHQGVSGLPAEPSPPSPSQFPQTLDDGPASPFLFPSAEEGRRREEGAIVSAPPRFITVCVPAICIDERHAEYGDVWRKKEAARCGRRDGWRTDGLLY